MKRERTLVIIKPDGVQRSLVGEIIGRFEKAGLKLIGIKMVVPVPEMVERHYLVDPNWPMVTGQKTIDSYRNKGKQPLSEDPLEVTQIVLKNLKKYMSAGPVIVMAWQGVHAIGIVRKLAGGTEPLSSDVGTIRGDYTIDSYELADKDGRAVRNLIHASGNSHDAEKELKLWFEDGELINYKLAQESILYDVNLDGIME